MRWSVMICFLTGLWTGGCATGPAPIVIHEERQESVWLHVDPRAGAGHSHPVSIAPEQMMTVLKGVRVKSRDVIGGFELLGDKDSVPAFSTREILVLAPHLSQAFQKASPKDIVTFHLATQDSGKGSLITSGGLFVRNKHLYLILANARTSPSAIQYENTYELDIKDQPLLPIARFKFSAGFVPNEAWMPTEQAKKADDYPGYVDESKLIVINLPRLFTQTGEPAVPRSQP